MEPKKLPYLNIAAYVFYPLVDTQSFKSKLKEKLNSLESLLGTILISHEGVNFYFAGFDEDISELKRILHTELGVPECDYKESYSEENPYRKLLFKIRKEIISTGISEIKPSEFTGKYISPEELKSWYDDNKDFVILDTRNDYEIKVGKFKNAQEFKIRHFREFFEKTKEAPENWKEKDVVTYCTGGIRCEKATAFMLQEAGFKNVFQLKGGILKYFEKFGGEHYEGDCFVFDHRVSVKSNLDEAETIMCFACRTPLLKHELESEDYIPDISCPYCVDKIKRDKISTIQGVQRQQEAKNT